MSWSWNTLGVMRGSSLASERLMNPRIDVSPAVGWGGDLLMGKPDRVRVGDSRATGTTRGAGGAMKVSLRSGSPGQVGLRGHGILCSRGQ